MKTFFYIAFILSVACNKSNNGDSTKPAINLTSPTANQQFSSFATVNINGSIVDDVQIHEMHIYVNNKATGAEIVHAHEHLDVQSHFFGATFTAQPATTYKIRVEANDHVGNSSSVEIEVKAN